MSELGDSFRAWNEEKKRRKQNNRSKHTKKLKDITDDYVELTPYQLRVFKQLDIYPTSGKYHCIKTGKRGFYGNLETFILKYRERHEL